MSDRLYLSCWLRDPSPDAVLAQYEKLLARFPYSKLGKRGPVLRVYVLEMTEPPATEREFALGAEASAIMSIARETASEDTACMVDGFWDLWQLDQEWSLQPAPVTLACYGPKFDNDSGDHLRIDFGLDAKFLPSSGDGARMAQENIRSLLHLVGDLEGALPLAKRQLWSESGESFAEVLASAISGLGVH